MRMCEGFVAEGCGTSANARVIVGRAAVGRGSRTVVQCILITRRTDGGWMRVWDEREMHDARWTEWCDHGAACPWQAGIVCRINVQWRVARLVKWRGMMWRYELCGRVLRERAHIRCTIKMWTHTTARKIVNSMSGGARWAGDSPRSLGVAFSAKTVDRYREAGGWDGCNEWASEK